MAWYVDQRFVKQAKPHSWYDEVHKPGTPVPRSGIYRCVNCGNENCCNAGDPFPPQNRHQHKTPAPIGWQLLVRPEQKGSAVIRLAWVTAYLPHKIGAKATTASATAISFTAGTFVCMNAATVFTSGSISICIAHHQTRPTTRFTGEANGH